MKLYLVLALGLLGCTEDVSSRDIRTSGVYPEFTVTATGNGRSEVEARLKVGGNNSNTFLDVESGDTLEVTANGESKTLKGGSGNRYTATFDFDDGGTEFVFAFLRTDADDDAPMSTVVLPEPFDMEVTSDDLERTVDDLEFTWDPPEDGDMKVKVEGDCLFPLDDNTPDDGTGSVNGEDLKQVGDDDGEECTASVELTRQNGGEIDAAFDDGEIRARQVRSDTFTSLPPPAE